MIRTVYKTLAFLLAFNAANAQVKVQPAPPAPPVAPDATVIAPEPPEKFIDDKELQKVLNDANLKAQDALKISKEQLKISQKQLEYINSKEFKLKIKDVSDKAALASKKALSQLNVSQKSLDLVNSKLAAIDWNKINNNINVDLQDLKVENFGKSFEGLDPDYKGIEKSKTISKSYSVDKNDKLSIDNQYGKVVINTWAKNEVRVDVDIKAYDSSDSRAQEMLDGVVINESKTSNLISFKTAITKSNNGWWGVRRSNGNEERRGVWINYTVYMPAKNPLDVTNRYGSTEVPDFEGPLNIVSGYGSFSGKTLSNAANNIKVSYGSANIESLRSGSLSVKYGSLNLGAAEKLNADVSYSSAKIGKLSGDGDITLRYTGGFKVGEIDRNVKNLNVDASYSSVSLGFDTSSSFNFDVTVNYAGFKYDDGKVNIVSKTPDDSAKGFSPSKNYKGTYGKGSDSRVIIRSNYGSVNFL
ncbi:hypothetical protein GS399_03230 [Pedobacter sp. HMF7647]|uniref:DUF4097 family beta strand repeat protein n=1 Tax=Hufsiella arboris TaxID=2695275 RepID=A0A7K1Y6D1_9SPHI|nr:hypothetical protein [Hufsiella arboris]MXV49971.1 hypothetical protein [Hufsiella arboris]